MKGSIKKRGSTWYYIVDIGRDENGKRRQKTKGGFRTKKEAQEALAVLLADLKRGEYIEDTKITFYELVSDWLQHTKPNIKQTTYAKYSRILAAHIKGSIGNLKIANLKPLHIARFYAQKSETLAPNTVRTIHNVISGSLTWAVKMGLIKKNPAENAELPKAKRRSFKVWSPVEIRQFLEAAKNRRHFPIYYLALMTGMRQGEILGLKWEDVDLENGVIHISRNWTMTDTVKQLAEGGKTEGARRSIDISQSVIDVLKEHKNKQAKELQALGIDTDFVFTNAKGELLHPTSIREFFQDAQKAAGVPVIRFHDLRHTHASILLQKGVHPKIVSERLGHSSISITLDIYSHLIPTIQKEAADAIESYITDVSKM